MALPTPWRVAVGAVVLLTVCTAPSAVHADPPGPTDFESSIVAVEPATDGITPSIIGGDAFFALDVEPGLAVTVAGYQGEPYLEFSASGEVRENRNSPTYFMSQTKLGAPVPAGVTADSPPRWDVVATDGTYAWHDHRAHFMGTQPSGARGDVVAAAVVPLVVDGVAVDVRVETVWLASASPWPAALGAVAGVLAAAGYIATRRRPAAVSVAGGTAAAALAIGFVQYRSVPAVTSPSPVGWVLPATALAGAAAAAWLVRRPGWSVFAVGALALTGVELTIWAWTRRAGLTSAILPTDAPFWLDRAVTAGAGVVGVAVAGLAALHLVELVTRPAGVSATAPRQDRT